MNIEKKHSQFPPSSAGRWFNCQASLFLPQEEQKDMTAANEGTLAHRLAELKLKRNEWMDYSIELEEVRNDPLYDPEMEVYTNEYVDLIRQIPHDEMLVEATVELDEYLKGLFGTVDCILMRENELTIIDFKYGHVDVEAKDNYQLMLYALGAYTNHFSRKYVTTPYPEEVQVNLIIYQPRVKNKLKREVLQVRDLLDFNQYKFRKVAYLIENKAMKEHPGPWCKYCKSKAYCSEYGNNLAAKVTYLEPISSFSTNELGALLDKLRPIEGYLKELKDRAKKEIQAGKTVEGYKLKSGRTSYYWNNEQAVMEKASQLGLDIATPISVAQFRKKYGNVEEFDELISSKVSAPSLIEIKKK